MSLLITLTLNVVFSAHTEPDKLTPAGGNKGDPADVADYTSMPSSLLDSNEVSISKYLLKVLSAFLVSVEGRS